MTLLQELLGLEREQVRRAALTLPQLNYLLPDIYLCPDRAADDLDPIACS